jgi:DNA-directed RNA polymerase specialized sigma24 family protein
MSWNALKGEFAKALLGPRILAEVERAVDLVVRRYDPVIYAGTPDWGQARDDLVQDVVTTILLGEHQLDYLFQVASGLDDFRALLYRQVRRLLARRRQRTVIDNLIDRVREAVAAPPFEQVPGAPPRFRLVGREVEQRSPTEDEIHLAATRVAAIPRVTFNATERAPVVYHSDALATVLQIVAETLPSSFSLQDVDRILRLVLTDWIPRFLEEGEESFSARDEELTPEEMVVMQDIVTRVLTAMSADQRLILLRKLEGISDAAVAEEVGVSRPTLAARKNAVFRTLEVELQDMDSELQRAVTGELALRLAQGGVAA